MPRRTRREKMLATQRREQLTPTNSIARPITDPEEMLIKKSFSEDLKKSLFLISLIFTLEIILYFASMSNYVSHFF